MGQKIYNDVKETPLFLMYGKKDKDYLDDIISKHYNNATLDVNDERSPFDLIPYAIGSFDDDRNPLQDKVKYMFRKIQSKHSRINVLEGGVRGGKDVFGLNVWSRILMLSKERTHLALGYSLEHVIRTVFDSNGFGLKNLIPHGRLVRDNEGGGFRAIFRFKNAYGEDREVIFYGNFKKDDYKKYQGFTIGTGYVNEGIMQHINGIHELFQRMFSSKDGTVILTQNPVGQSHDFYQKIEKNYMLSEEEIAFIEVTQNDKLVHKKWDLFLAKIEQMKKDAVATAKKEYLRERNKFKFSDLPIEDKEKFRLLAWKIINDIEDGSETVIDGKKVINYGLFSVPIEEFTKLPTSLITKKSRLIGASMYKIMKYDRGLENINGVVNGLDYSYFHFTMEDNIGMNDMQRREASREFGDGTSLAEQRVLGKRVSSDGKLLAEFSDFNIISDETIEEVEERLKLLNTIRVISIDPAFNHPTAIVDCEVDLVNGMIYQLGEEKVDMKEWDYKERNALPIEQAVWRLIRRRKRGKLPDLLIIDPSAVMVISHFITIGFNVVEANNETQSAKARDMKYSDNTVKKNTKGVDLLKQGFLRGKFFIHIECPMTINEMQNMSVKFNETTGNEDIIKLNDDLFDAFKYVANTSGITPELWNESEVLNKYENEQLSNDEREEDSEWDLERELQKLEEEEYGEDELDSKYSNFLYGNGRFN